MILRRLVAVTIPELIFQRGDARFELCHTVRSASGVEELIAASK